MKRFAAITAALLLCCMLSACSSLTGSSTSVSATITAPSPSAAPSAAAQSTTPVPMRTTAQQEDESAASMPVKATVPSSAALVPKEAKSSPEAAAPTKTPPTAKATTAKATTTTKATTPRASTTLAAQEPESGQTVYITDTGEKYHRSGCRYLKKSAHAIAKDRAVAQGYTPCKVCKP